MKHLLICGDSFAADWSVEYPDAQGWPNLLADHFDITNLAQAGCSEYRIWNQIRSVDLSVYDWIIVSHTSPYRLFVRHHPVHRDSKLRSNADFIYNDVKAHELDVVRRYYEEFYDLDYAKDIHKLIIRAIHSYQDNILHIGHLDIGAPDDVPIVDFQSLWQQHQGFINHYDEYGNQEVCRRLLTHIK